MTRIMNRFARILMVLAMMFYHTGITPVRAAPASLDVSIDKFDIVTLYDINYHWFLDKSASPTTFDLHTGQTGTTTYTVTATRSEQIAFDFTFTATLTNMTSNDISFDLYAVVAKPSGSPELSARESVGHYIVYPGSPLTFDKTVNFLVPGTATSIDPVKVWLSFENITGDLTASDISGTKSAAINFNATPTNSYNASLYVTDSWADAPDPWTFNGTDTVTYTRTFHPNGTADYPNTVTGTLEDASTITASANVHINTVNTAPVANAQSVSTPEDTALGITLTGSDPDGDAITYHVVANPTHGSLSGTAPDLTYTPNANYNGSDSFTFRVNDSVADSPTATVSITVTPVNDAPVAVNDSYSTPEDTPKVVVAAGVLGNDSDIDSASLTAIKVSDPAHGSVTLNSDGSFTYTPTANYNGPDSFTYKANDGSLDSNIATVSITVASVNDAPVAVNDTYSTNEDTPLTVASPGVLTNDTDADANALTAVKVSEPSHGTVTLNANGSFTYTPAANYNGPDSFTYKANDGLLDSNIATVSITVNPVNDAPVALADSYSTDEDSPLTIAAPGVLANDSDIDSASLTAVKVAEPVHGSVTLNANGSFTYTPTANYNGPDSFTYRAYDGSAYSTTVTVSLTVNPVNDAPVAVADSYSTNEDTPLTVTAPGVLVNDTDLDLNALTAVKVADPAHGSVTLNANGSFTYTPAPNYFGSDSFTYRAYDGAAYSTTVTVSLTVNPVNDTPVAVGDSYSTNEDTLLTVTTPGVLTNDSDVDSASLTVSKIDDPAHGTLTLNPVGSFTYNPAANYNGPDSFTYRAYDGFAYSNTVTVTLTVNPVNDAPVAVADSYSTDEDTPLIVVAPGVLVNDSDIDSASLTAIKATDPTHGSVTLNSDGSFTYTPELNFNGSDSFTYKSNDGLLDSNSVTVTLTVNPVNDGPVAVADTYSTDEDTPLIVAAPGVLTNDTDVDLDILSTVKVTDPANGTLTLNSDGSFTYTPVLDFNGSDSFTYKVNDGTVDSDTVTVSLTVNPVDDPPVAVADTGTTAYMTALTLNVLANDTDVDGGPMTIDLLSTPVGGTAVLNPDKTVTYTPNAGFSGSDSFTYTLNGGSSTTVTVTVLPPTPPPPNLPPIANPLAITVAAGGSVSGNVSGSDPEGIPLIFGLAAGPASSTGGLTIDPASGAFTYTHNGNAATGDSFTFTVNDWAFTTTGTVTITIIQPTPPPANTAPVASDGSASTPFETVLNGRVVAADADGDPLTYELMSDVDNGLLVMQPNGYYTYTPDAGFSGTDSFTFRVNDGTDDSNVATYTITVGEEIIITPPETPQAALPMDLSWAYWLAGLIAALLNFLAFLRPNIKYTLMAKDGTHKTIRRRLARPDSDIMFVEMTDKGLEDLVGIDVMIYKRLAKHLDNVTVSFMLHNRIVETVTIPADQAEAYLTHINL